MKYTSVITALLLSTSSALSNDNNLGKGMGMAKGMGKGKVRADNNNTFHQTAEDNGNIVNYCNVGTSHQAGVSSASSECDCEPIKIRGSPKKNKSKKSGGGSHSNIKKNLLA